MTRCARCRDELGVSPWPNPDGDGEVCHDCYIQISGEVGLIVELDPRPDEDTEAGK